MLVSIEYADTYFAKRLGAFLYWTSGAEKEAALQTAENQLAAVYGSISDKFSVCEQALFLLRDADIDARASLQAQGVTAAAVVGESYKGGGSIPICPYALNALGEPSAALLDADMEMADEEITYEL